MLIKSHTGSLCFQYQVNNFMKPITTYENKINIEKLKYNCAKLSARYIRLLFLVGLAT